MYIYEGHLGGLYTTEEQLEYEDLYCEECGDSDTLIGYAETKEEAWNLLKEDTDTNGSGGWDYNYVQEFINSNWINLNSKGNSVEERQLTTENG